MHSRASGIKSSFCICITHLYERKMETVPEQDRLEQDYYDYLQAPLQPLQVGDSVE